MGRTNGQGKYLYAISMDAEQLGHGSAGIGKRPVYTIQEGRLGALVSDVPNARIRPERRNLAAHRDVLRLAMGESTVLPLAFGIIADNERGVRRILKDNAGMLSGQLSRVAGKVEMGLRVSWDVPNIFEYFISTHRELREARDALFGSRTDPSREERISLGRLFSRLLEEDREAFAERVRGVLEPHCAEVRENPCRKESEVLNFACLIGRGREAEFEAAVFEAARLFDNNFAFDYNGPWAPHNFVDARIEL